MDHIRGRILLKNFISDSDQWQCDLQLSYHIYGQTESDVPTVLVNHALTGNAAVSGNNGWWSELIDDGKCIVTLRYKVIAFNIPGNGQDDFFIRDHQAFSARDIVRIFNLGLSHLKICDLHAVIGGSLGGGIAWELLHYRADQIHHLIPVASDWKSTDWIMRDRCGFRSICYCNLHDRFSMRGCMPYWPTEQPHLSRKNLIDLLMESTTYIMYAIG